MWGGQLVVAQTIRPGASVVPSLVLEVQTVPGEQLVLVPESLENASLEVRRSAKGSAAAGQVYSAWEGRPKNKSRDALPSAISKTPLGGAVSTSGSSHQSRLFGHLR